MRCIFLAIFCTAVTSLFSQNINDVYFQRPEPKRIYIGTGPGINYLGYLGVSVEQNFKGKQSIIVAGGKGSWGYKLQAGWRYYLSSHSEKSVVGKGIGINYVLAIGNSNFRTVLETASGSRQLVNLQLFPIHAINLTFFKCWKLGNGTSRFGLDAGYSIALNSGDNFKVLNSGVTLSNKSYSIVKAAQPGGIILAMSFTFGR